MLITTFTLDTSYQVGKRLEALSPDSAKLGIQETVKFLFGDQVASVDLCEVFNPRCILVFQSFLQNSFAK